MLCCLVVDGVCAVLPGGGWCVTCVLCCLVVDGVCAVLPGGGWRMCCAAWWWRRVMMMTLLLLPSAAPPAPCCCRHCWEQSMDPVSTHIWLDVFCANQHCPQVRQGGAGFRVRLGRVGQSKV